MTDERRIMVEEVDAVDAPPRRGSMQRSLLPASATIWTDF